MKKLKVEHLVEIKSLKQPPSAVSLVLAGVCILMQDEIKK